MITYILKKTLIVLFLFLSISNYAQRSHPIQKISKTNLSNKGKKTFKKNNSDTHIDVIQ